MALVSRSASTQLPWAEPSQPSPNVCILEPSDSCLSNLAEAVRAVPGCTLFSMKHSTPPATATMSAIREPAHSSDAPGHDAVAARTLAYKLRQ